MSRIPTNYNKLESLEYISSEDLLAIELNAAMLELDELYEMLFIEPEELTEAEVRYCKVAFRRGKKKSIADASNYLFARMKERNGTQACIEFLQNVGKFSIDGTSTPASGSSKGGFSFNVIMPGDNSADKAETPKPAAAATPLAEAS